MNISAATPSNEADKIESEIISIRYNLLSLIDELKVRTKGKLDIRAIYEKNKHIILGIGIFVFLAMVRPSPKRQICYIRINCKGKRCPEK